MALSMVFGVAASSDSKTVTSQLNKRGQTPASLAVAVFNSTQELLLLQLFKPRNLEQCP